MNKWNINNPTKEGEYIVDLGANGIALGWWDGAIWLRMWGTEQLDVNGWITIPYRYNNEIILCAAIWYKEIEPRATHRPINTPGGVVLCGYRHGDIISQLMSLTGKKHHEMGESIQGFLTNKNRFVNRKEAAEIAYNAGQVNDRIRWYEMTDQDWKTRELFSEDLY